MEQVLQICHVGAAAAELNSRRRTFKLSSVSSALGRGCHSATVPQYRSTLDGLDGLVRLVQIVQIVLYKLTVC